jgi:hypothetical protein
LSEIQLVRVRSQISFLFQRLHCVTGTRRLATVDMHLLRKGLCTARNLQPCIMSTVYARRLPSVSYLVVQKTACSLAIISGGTGRRTERSVIVFLLSRSRVYSLTSICCGKGMARKVPSCVKPPSHAWDNDQGFGCK